jgi:uncharacterized protein (DUF305 family)
VKMKTFMLMAALVALAVPAQSVAQPSISTVAPFDRAFIDGMVPHHQMAIEMAQVALHEGLSKPVLVRIAENIKASQQTEITRMKSWRKAWYGSSKIDPKDAMALGMSMSEMGMSGGTHGLMTAKNINQAFASMMITHHKGAIAMAKMALEKAKHPQIKQLARQIIAAQQREIRLMKPYASSSMTGMHG